MFLFYWFEHLDFIENAKNGMLHINDSTAIIHKVNLTQKLGSKQDQMIVK